MIFSKEDQKIISDCGTRNVQWNRKHKRKSLAVSITILLIIFWSLYLSGGLV